MSFLYGRTSPAGDRKKQRDGANSRTQAQASTSSPAGSGSPGPPRLLPSTSGALSLSGSTASPARRRRERYGSTGAARCGLRARGCDSEIRPGAPSRPLLQRFSRGMDVIRGKPPRWRRKRRLLVTSDNWVILEIPNFFKEIFDDQNWQTVQTGQTVMHKSFDRSR